MSRDTLPGATYLALNVGPFSIFSGATAEGAAHPWRVGVIIPDGGPVA